ncbi:activating transcription factor 7-interacting protein 1-like isoform X2 [Haliotis cracherodii]|uniref:activating transcription factor 7-interacting protein 1-like isoform X2 n=1 Tax=Haliotis cracherodii TaxID=6455 RepID=UPI0039EA214F
MLTINPQRHTPSSFQTVLWCRMSTKEPQSQVFKHSVKGDSIKITTARKSTAKLGQGWSLPKLGITKSEGDSGIGSSDSSDSMSDVKDSFQEAIMNLKALNGEGDSAKTESALESDAVTEKSGNCNGKSILKTVDIDDQANGDAKTVASPGVDSKPSDNGHETPSIQSANDSKDGEEQEESMEVTDEVADEVTEQCEEAAEVQSDEPSKVQSEEPLEALCEKPLEIQSEEPLEARSEEQSEIQSEEPSEIQSEEPSEVHSEAPSEIQSEEPSEVQSEEPSEVQSEIQSDVQSEMQSGAPSEIQSEEISQDADREISVEPEVSTSDKIEIIDSDNEDTNETSKTPNSCDDDEVMLLSERETLTEKDEKSQDSELGDHPLTIGDKVRNSVRDIMSKLKQGNELNKLLVKPKHEESMDVELTTGSSEKTSEKSKLLPPSPRKGNLFENLTGIGAGSSSKKTEGKSANDKQDGNSVAKNSSEQLGSQESDVELIDDDFDKKDDDIILCDDEEPMLKSNSGNSNVTQGTDEIKSESDSKETTTTETKTECRSSENDKPSEQMVKKEVKSERKVENEDEIKPMEIEEDSEVKDEVKMVKHEDSAEAAPASRTDRKRSQEDQSSESGIPPKRSRLDMVIGKLGSQIGISPDTIKSDTSDEDSHPGSEMSEKSEDALSSVSDEDDDKTSQSSTKTIRLSGKELEALVRSKVSAYLKAHRDSKMESLKSKIVDLQMANESWRTQAKELQKKVLDLTVLQQRLEKRKAATAALRQITTRSVAVQADDTKTNFATGLAVKQPKTPPKAAAPATSTSFSMPIFSSNTAAAPVSSTSVAGGVLISGSKIAPAASITASTVNRSSVSQLLSATAVLQTTPSTSTTLIGGHPPLGTLTGVRPQLAQHLSTALPTALPTSLTTVRSLLDNTKTIDTTSKLQTVSGQPISGSNVIVVSSPNLAGQVGAKGIVNVPKVIDLTSDDDNAKGPATATQPARTMTVMPGTAVSALRPGLVQQQVIRGVNPLTLQQSLTSGTSILLSSPGLVNAGPQSLTRPGGTFQIVTVASGSNLRPGTLLTVVPASSHVNTQQTQIRTTVPTVLPVAKSAGAPVGQTMPQLRPGTSLSQISVSTPVRPATSLQTVTARPPPPLQTAPSSTPVSTPITLAPAPAPTPAPAPSPVPTQKHPAPLPAKPTNQVSRGIKGVLPPKPGLKISRVSQGIVLSWNMTLQDNHAEIASYQLFAYQESSAPPSTTLWKKVGDVKALPLPMACTLTQFQEGNKYHFAVRAVDNHTRLGDFSDPSTIHLTPK